MNEYQSAFEQASIELKHKIGPFLSDIYKERERIIASGNFALVAESLHHCPYTDAVIGSFPYKVMEFKTREEALTEADKIYEESHGEEYVHIYPKLKIKRIILQGEEEEIPF